MNLRVDISIKEAIDVWISHGLDPGSCTRLLLKGDYEEAKKHAHPLILPHWDDHIAYVESIHIKYRHNNMKAWKESFDN